MHTITGGWSQPILVCSISFKPQDFELTRAFFCELQPVIPGHEITGTVVNVGSKVTSIKIGDRVGVGAQIGSCLNCPPCKSGDEQ